MLLHFGPKTIKPKNSWPLKETFFTLKYELQLRGVIFFFEDTFVGSSSKKSDNPFFPLFFVKPQWRFNECGGNFIQHPTHPPSSSRRLPTPILTCGPHLVKLPKPRAVVISGEAAEWCFEVLL